MMVANIENILKNTVEFMLYNFYINKKIEKKSSHLHQPRCPNDYEKQNLPANHMDHKEEMNFVVLSHGNLGLLC